VTVRLARTEAVDRRGFSSVPTLSRSGSLDGMAIVTKRNAVVGWFTLKYGKRVGKIVARDQARQLKKKMPFRRKTSK
jgi:hypothetical protein